MTLRGEDTRRQQQRIARQKQANQHAGFGKDDGGNHQHAATSNKLIDIKHCCLLYQVLSLKTCYNIRTKLEGGTVSDEKISLTLEQRDVFGKAVKGLRRDGVVPAVVHNHGKDSLHVQAPAVQLTKVYLTAGKHHPVDLTVGGKKYLALIKDADFEPKKHTLRHVVFNAIRQDEKTTAEIPLVLTGEIPAEKASLIVLRHLEQVEVEALPRDLVDQLEVDATSLAENGDKIQVSDITVPNGVTILTDPEATIATVEIPRDQVAEANAAAEEQAETDGKADEVPSDNGGEPSETKAD